MQRKGWTREEDDALRTMMADGCTAEFMAQRLQRPVNTVFARKYKLLGRNYAVENRYYDNGDTSVCRITCLNLFGEDPLLRALHLNHRIDPDREVKIAGPYRPRRLQPEAQLSPIRSALNDV